MILDGSKIQGDWVNCLHISSSGNVIRGLQIINFPGSGISLRGKAQNNIIGGSRVIGAGPLGQGNLLSNNYVGLDLQGENTSFNTIIGNIIGANIKGLTDQGNSETGIYVANGASHNKLGPDNIIAYNQEGIQIYRSESIGNTITQNSIHDNDTVGISLNESGNSDLLPPQVMSFDLETG